jgi:hypothetical protein
VANGRKRKKRQFLPDGNNHITGDENLVKHATEYYRTLFDPGPGNAFNLDHELWNENDFISVTENQNLIKPFDEEEIKVPCFR